MRNVEYLAVLEKSSDGYGVFFPDLPGCISYGSDLKSAKKNAEEALKLHITGMEEDNDPVPAPSSELSAEDKAIGIVVPISVSLEDHYIIYSDDLMNIYMDTRRKSVKDNYTATGYANFNKSNFNFITWTYNQNLYRKDFCHV